MLRLLNTRLLVLACVMLIAAACGQEAPRVTQTHAPEPTTPDPTATQRPPNTPAPTATGAPSPTPVPATVTPTEVSEARSTPGADPRAKGDPSAPIVVVEYSDFQ